MIRSILMMIAGVILISIGIWLAFDQPIDECPVLVAPTSDGICRCPDGGSGVICRGMCQRQGCQCGCCK